MEKRYNVKKMNINGEAGDVRGEKIDSWKERLQGYSRCDIYNLNETACFWRALPDHDFGKKVQNAKVAKKPNRGLLLSFWLTQMERRKIRFLYGNQKTQSVSGELIRPSYQCSTLVNQRDG